MSMLTEIVEVIEEDEKNGGDAGKERESTAILYEHPSSWAWSGNVVEIAVAVGTGASSLQALKWVLDNGMVTPGGLLHLLHIQAPLRFIPSPMGNNIPVESVSEDVANRHKLQRFLATEQLLHRYKKMCDDKQVNSEVCYAEGDVVYKELVGQISSLCVTKIILGTSSQSRITKALKKQTISSLVAKNAPDFCTVVVVCKGKLHSVKEAAKAFQHQAP
eukprot:c24224_g1_i1 orf=1405-2058(-)